MRKLWKIKVLYIVALYKKKSIHTKSPQRWGSRAFRQFSEGRARSPGWNLTARPRVSWKRTRAALSPQRGLALGLEKKKCQPERALGLTKKTILKSQCPKCTYYIKPLYRALFRNALRAASVEVSSDREISLFRLHQREQGLGLTQKKI